MNKQLRRIVKEAQRVGWTLVETRSGGRLLSPDGETSVGFHRGQGDPRSNKNTIAAIRRGGTPDFMR